VTSNINYLSINENFPVAGADNDTQVFRDNFDTIKNSLRAGSEEITALQAYTAKTNDNNNFGNYELTRAVFRNTMIKKFDAGIIPNNTAIYTVDYENGGYQVLRFASNMSLDFQNLPQNSSAAGPVGVGKITLELYGDGTNRTLTFITSSGTELRRNANFPVSLSVSSTTAPIIIDVWRHNASYIFMHYHGQYS
jgi:hypothetical protein